MTCGGDVQTSVGGVVVERTTHVDKQIKHRS